MRTAAAIALVVTLVGIAALCPVVTCFAQPLSHPCCPRHNAPPSARDCPSSILENSRIAPRIALAIPLPSLSGMAAPRQQSFPSLAPVPTVPLADDLFRVTRVLRI